MATLCFLEHRRIHANVFMFDCVSRHTCRACLCARTLEFVRVIYVCECVVCTCEIAKRERERERESGSVSACKLKRLHLCGSAPWQKAWVRPSLRGVIDGRVAVVTRCKQERAVSLFAAWRLSLRCAIVTPDVLLVMNRDRESVYWVGIMGVEVWGVHVLI